MKKQTGFTLFELLFLIAFIAAIIAVIGGGYVLFHFLAKFW